MKQSRKLLALFLAVLLSVGCFAVPVSAQAAATGIESAEASDIIDVISAPFLRIYRAILTLFENIKTCLMDWLFPLKPENALIINQVYGLGNKNDDKQAGSHSFVELYNPTDRSIKLSGYTLQAAGNEQEWSVLPLSGEIPAKHSFLVVLTEITNQSAEMRLALDPTQADMLWDGVIFPNKGLKVALVKSLEPLQTANPFDVDGKGSKAAGYADMIGIAGNDAGSTIDGCETAYPAFQSKQNSARRINYHDTNNNKNDLMAIDYRTADIGMFGPRSLASGANLPVMENDPADKDALLPKVFITLAPGNTLHTLNKEDYVGALVTMNNAGEFNIPGLSAGVRLRGNSTAYAPKRPLRIKFDSATSVFGRPAEKSWTLLANHYDYSLMRNYIAYNMYDHISPDGTFSSLVQFVDVYVNNEYQGVYTLCDQIESGEGRVNVPTSTKNADTGYLLEYDYRIMDEGSEGTDYFKVSITDPLLQARNGWGPGTQIPYAIKSPDPDDGIPAANINFIQAYMQSVHDAIATRDFTQISQKIDVESFIDFFMLAEIFQLTDIGGLSVYMYKDKGGKLKMGPAWDYDLSVGNAIHTPRFPTGTFWAEQVNPLFAPLMDCPEFASLYMQEYLDSYADYKAYLTDFIDTSYETYHTALERNFLKWDIWNYDQGFETPEIDAIKTHKGQVDFIRNWLCERLDWLNAAYDSRLNNGGTFANPFPG